MKNELQEIREQKQKLEKMLYKRYKAMYDFLKFKTIQSFGMIFIKNDIIAFDMASDEQEKITKNLREFASNTKLKRLNLKKEKQGITNIALELFKGREMVFNALIVRYFQCPQENKKQKNQAIMIKQPNQDLASPSSSP